MKQTRFKLLVPLIILVVIMIWALPAFLKAMPDRYVVRLPEPLQKLGLPDDQEALLPTIASPIQARELLLPKAAKTDDESNTQVSQITPEMPTPKPFILSSSVESSGLENEPTKLTSIITPTTLPIPSPTPWPIPVSARLEGFQHKFQEWNNCGPATLAMALTYFDLNVSQADTAAVLKPNPEDRNVSPNEMADYVNEQTPFQAVFRSNGNRDTLRRLVANNLPVIVEIGIEPPGEYRWMGWYGHYLLVVAYDDSQEQFWVYDSWFGTSEEPLQNAHPDGRKLSYSELEKLWPQFNRNYIVPYETEQAEDVVSIIGDEMDDQTMWENTLAAAQTDITDEPNNAFYWFNLGTAYNALEQYVEAATAFDQARALGLPWRMLWYQFGPYEAYYKTGRYDDVILLADVTLKDRPYFEESYYYKGLALAAQGDNDEAKRNLELAVEFNPNYNPAMKALAVMN